MSLVLHIADKVFRIPKGFRSQDDFVETEAVGLSNETDDLQPAARTNDKKGYKNPGYLFRK